MTLPEHLRNVPLHDTLLLLLQDALGLVLHHVVFPEMLNVLRVDEVLLLGILVVVFLEMVDLVLVLIVAVVARAQPEVRQLLARLDRLQPLVARDLARRRRVEEGENVVHRAVLDVVGRGFEGFVEQAVESTDFVRRPDAVVVEIVQREE